MKTKAQKPAAAHDARRRDFLKGLAGTTALAAASIPAVAAAKSDETTAWAMTADIVIVGSGIAATSAAIAATKAGADVIMLEKLPFQGGTTAKSAGVFWIPNNPLLRASGVKDERLDALRYMARLAQPTLYRSDHPTLGIPADEFELLGVFVDNASRVVEELMASTGLKPMSWLYAEDSIWPDYYGHIPENKVGRGRSLVCNVKDVPERHFWAGGGGAGNSMLWQLQQGFDKRPIKVLLDHAVTAVTRNAKGEVNGVVVDSGEDQPIRARAKKAVIFATGGFTHNVAMADAFLRGNIWGGCAAPGSTGDFVGIAAGLGAPLANMNNAWWAQVPVEIAIKTRSVPFNVWCPPGDSMIEVNRYGVRFGNEKIAYNERTQLHFTWDPVKLEYPNRLGFMIWDQRTADGYGGYDPIPAKNAKVSHLIEGATMNAKGQVLDAKAAPIAGLYGAGNCVASPAHQAYWGGGGTIGPAMTFGYLAGTAAAAESEKTA